MENYKESLVLEGILFSRCISLPVGQANGFDFKFIDMHTNSAPG